MLFFFNLGQSQFKIINILFQFRSFVFKLSLLGNEFIVHFFTVFKIFLKISDLGIEFDLVIDQCFASTFSIIEESHLLFHLGSKFILFLLHGDSSGFKFCLSLGFFAFLVVLFEFLKLLAFFGLRDQWLDFEHNLHPFPILQEDECSQVRLDKINRVTSLAHFIEFDSSKLVTHETLYSGKDGRNLFISVIFKFTNNTSLEEQFGVTESVFDFIKTLFSGKGGEDTFGSLLSIHKFTFLLDIWSQDKVTLDEFVILDTGWVTLTANTNTFQN